MREIYEFGFKLGKSGVFDKNQIIMITRLFYNDIDKNKLLEMILKACNETKITMCDLLTNNLYDSETKFNFQIGLLNGAFYEEKEESALNNVISLKEAAEIVGIPTTTFRTAVQKGEYDDVGKKISSIWVFDKDLLFKKYICKKEIDKFLEDYTESNKKIIYDFIEKHKIDKNTNNIDINGRIFNFNWKKDEINIITLSTELINYKYLHKASNSYKNTNIFKDKDFYVENFRDLRFLLDTYEIELYIDSSCSENNFKTLTTFLLPTSEILSDEFLNKFEEILSKYEDKFSREIEYLSERF